MIQKLLLRSLKATAKKRARLQAQAAPFLEPGEEIDAVFYVNWGYRTATRPLVVTDRRILEFSTTVWIGDHLKRVYRELPRDVRFGPIPDDALTWPVLPSVLGKRCHVEVDWFRDLREADERLASRTPHPDSPSPPGPG
jgi:hypothetical protein